MKQFFEPLYLDLRHHTLDTFLIPFTKEFVQLTHAHRVHTLDAHAGASFDVHACLLTASSGIPAMSKVLYLKGVNSYVCSLPFLSESR